MRHLPIVALSLLSSVATVCDANAQTPAAFAAGHPAVDPTNPQTCAPCHGNIVEEWSESMHSMAHQSRDPIFGAMREMRMKKQGPQLGAQCARCHSPVAVEAPESPAAVAGVSCAACHQLSGVELTAESEGAPNLKRVEEVIFRGPHDLAPNASPVHGTGPAAPWLTDGKTVCMSCHSLHTNHNGLAVCSTGQEQVGEAKAEQCTSCHMPEVQGPAGAVGGRATHRSHIFSGPHRLWLQNDDSLMKTAVGLSVRFEGAEVVVTLKNGSSHGFPTGFPGRMALVEVVGEGADGAQVWRNAGKGPMKIDPKAVLNRVYLSGEGKPTMPPFAAKPGPDRRLKSGETRELRYAVPATVSRVKARVKYVLAPPPMVKKLKLGDRPEARPKVITAAEAQRHF